jgi:membrane-associated phospholipid phosphatase
MENNSHLHSRLDAKAKGGRGEGWHREALTSLTQFARRWHPPPKLPRSAASVSLSIGSPLAAILCVLTLIAVGWSIDVDIVRLAGTLPPYAVSILSDFTKLGLAGYMLWLSAAIGLGAIFATSRVQVRRLRAGYEVLAMRALYFFVVVASTGILTQIVKHILGRARPKLLDQFGAFHFEFFSLHADAASFPSGHTVTAFAAATALGFFIPRWQSALFVLALAIGISRVAVGAHYPTDVLGGMVFGMVLAILIARLFARRNITFHVADGKLRRRGEGLVKPALWALVPFRRAS